MKDNDFKLEASGEFPFTFYIEKAIAKDEGDDMVIEGVASTVNIDHDNERMSASALVNMADSINESAVPLRIEHQKEDGAIVGSVFDAHVDERDQLWVKARLDKNHPASSILYKRLKDGLKLGLSVGGRVKRAVKEFSEASGRAVKTFYDVALDEVSVTQRPANYDAWLLAKSIISKNEDATKWYESPLYKEFISEIGGMDYMASFAKSVPNKEWHKVELSEIIKSDMKDKIKKEEDMTEEEKKKSADGGEHSKEPEKESPKEVTNKSEFEAFKSTMTKGLESLTSLVSKLVTKMSDKKDEMTEEDKEKSMDDKEDETKEKEMKDGETKDEDKTKKGMDEKDEDKTKEKAMDDKKDDETTKAMKEMVKRIEDLSKAMDDKEDETKEKAMDDKDDEKTEKSMKGETLESFLGGLQKAIGGLEERLEKSGHRVPGIGAYFANMIKSDAEIQKSIKELMAEPSFRKSRAFGTPVIRDRSGKAFTITPITETVKKSVKEDGSPRSFKELYKSEYSSVAEASEQ